MSISSASHERLMHEEVFPSVRIGSRFVVPKDTPTVGDGRLEVPDENLDKARPGQELFSSAQ